jgi:hypothetical protein
MPEYNERQRLLAQALVLLDRTAIKLTLTPLGCALDVDFLESVVLFVGAVQSHLENVDEASDTIPAGPTCTCITYAANAANGTAVVPCPQHDACGRCGQTRAVCACA